MNIIELPVAPLSKRILLAENGGSEPIHLGHRNLLYRQMCYRTTETPYLPRHQQALTTTIKIQIHRHLWERVVQKPYQIGYHLYQLHKQQMFVWVDGKTSAGVEQMTAVRDFLQMYQIEDEEFSEETAYRLWKRFTKNAITNTPSIVPQMLSLKIVPLDQSQAIQIAEKVIDLSKVWCQDLHHKTRLVIPSYVLYKYTDLTFREAGKILGREYCNVYRSYTLAQNALTNYPRLNEVIDYCLATIDNKATP